MEFSPDTHLLLYLIPSNRRELASKASCTGLMSKQSPSGISSGQNKGKSQRLEEEREKSDTIIYSTGGKVRMRRKNVMTTERHAEKNSDRESCTTINAFL